MLDLETAIKHCEEVVMANEKSIEYYKIQGDKKWLDENEEDCIECAAEHRQLAEWLKELKQLKHVLSYELNGVKEKIKAKEKYDVNLSVYKGCLEDFMQFVFDIKTQEMCSRCKYYDYWGTYSISCDGKITGDKHCDLEFIDVFLGDKCHFERKEGCEGVSANDD